MCHRRSPIEEARRREPMSDAGAVRRITYLLDLGGWVAGELCPVVW